LPLISIVNPVIEAIKNERMHTVGFLGTIFTINEGFYANRLAREGIKTFVPIKMDQHRIQQIIVSELTMGRIKRESKEFFLRIVDDLEKEGAQGIVLGCTEIPLLLAQENCTIKLFDSTLRHAESTLRYALDWREKSLDERGGRGVYRMERRIIGKAPKGLPFSSGILVGDTFYLSGSIGFDEKENKVVDGGIEAETRKAIENLEVVLREEGMNLRHVVKVTAYLADINDYEKFNSVYRQYFSDHLPARETVAVSGVALGAKIELSFIAVK
jgi:reactive intermediate/imine deaminase